ncbi:phospholipase D-like domain-containing protein [Paraburkholderia tropica]|uniref:phospholipase D-like domain-containing protein n=2 Tax=Paraburkholderia tropica TaxID=92647 RepID=UPI001612B3FD|nr:phospholipase D-like domain-containing protein [Paraburkholderia tropica]MBB2982994.1 phospholipase D1/2 [Paraburkholderia tropica]
MEATSLEGSTGLLFDASPIKTLRQIIDEAGNALTSNAADNRWVLSDQSFSWPRTGNTVTPFTTGKSYFKKLAEELEGAQKSIYIGGWQVNWDAQFAPGGLRLFDVLLKAARANAGLKIYVMPWKHSPPIQTYDKQTVPVLEAINELVGRKCVTVTLAASLADEDPGFFSHHQKFVVIDEHKAFIGGMDVCYGRFDDETYDLHADAEGREGLNRYNGCIPHLGHVKPEKLVDPDLLTGAYDNHPTFGGLWASNRSEILKKIENGAVQTDYSGETPYWSAMSRPTGLSPSDATLDATRQPRMPWQDVHVLIEGPSAADIARNFVYRWNSEGGEKTPLDLPAEPEAVSGGCTVQVLRSAPFKMRKAEYAALKDDAKKDVTQPTGKQCEIALAMKNLIEGATSFIYIENQFFVSAFGVEHTEPDKTAANVSAESALSGPAQKIRSSGFQEWATHLVSDKPNEAPKNFICEALGERIGKAIMSGAKENFHVIITLPVHPEGKLSDGNIMAQVHWTMQTLVFGTFSLLNRVRRYIKARELRDKKVADWKKATTDPDDRRYEDVDMDRCSDYVTLLNLRNWAQLGDRYVTEQIYIHTKMMIVDDLFALLGSANINDRSMLGSRDSEIAVLISDSAKEKHDISGNGDVRITRNFARELRKGVWSKIFGLTGKVRSAEALRGVVEQPANPENWKKIQQVAEANRLLYEAAFDFIPRNTAAEVGDGAQSSYASIWPTWNADAQSTLGRMPFDDEFWSKPRHMAGASKLTEVRGFLVALPIDWTRNENNNLGYAISLVAENNAVPVNPVDSQSYGVTELSQAAQAKSKSAEEQA